MAENELRIAIILPTPTRSEEYEKKESEKIFYFHFLHSVWKFIRRVLSVSLFSVWVLLLRGEVESVWFTLLFFFVHFFICSDSASVFVLFVLL